MSNFACEAKPKYEYVKQVFLDKDFPEDVVDYVLLRSSNYVYENLESSMSMLEKEMNKARDEFRSGIGKLDERIGKLDEKINTNHKELIGLFKEIRSENNSHIKSLI